MWKKPAQVTDPLSQVLWNLVVNSGLVKYKIPVEEMPVPSILMAWLSDIVSIARTSSNQKVFARRFGEFVSGRAQVIAQAPESLHTLHCHIQKLDRKLEPFFGREMACLADAILTYLIAGVSMLLGSETRVLVGIKDKEFVWKKVRKISPEEAPDATSVSMYATYAVLPAVGPNDVWMVPEFRELDGDAKSRYDYGGGYREQCENLIERAFYGQEYTIDPEGVYVKITNSDEDVTGVYLKVQSRGNELLNILARIETSKGAFFIVIAEDQLLDGVTTGDVFVRGATYFDLLVCQVYHDLVTVVDAPIARADREGVVADNPPSRRGEGGVSWTVIPRRVRNQVRSPRSPAPSAASVKEPVSVSGHSRRGRMTPKHKLELEKFEAETGLRILDRLPPGKTYVRPHFSPKVSNEEVRKMPRFIRYRMQQRLDQSLQKDG